VEYYVKIPDENVESVIKCDIAHVEPKIITDQGR